MHMQNLKNKTIDAGGKTDTYRDDKLFCMWPYELSSLMFEVNAK